MGTEPVAEVNDEVTAPVTERVPPTAWELAGMTKETWDGLEIPEFLRREPKETASGPTAPGGGIGTSHVAHDLPRALDPLGPEPAPPVMGMTGTASMDFSAFRVDPDEIEQKIKREADQRWRNWVPTKTDRKRPRLSTYLKRVRKEYSN